MDSWDVRIPEGSEGPGEILVEAIPARSLKTLYTLYLLVIVWIGILPWLIPLAFRSPPILTLGVSLLLLIGVISAIWWIRAYCRSIRYRFTTSGIVWEQGVWPHRTGIVPYQRIAGVDLRQGPLSRLFGISDLDVQTAGPSGGPPGGGKVRIRGMADPEAVLALIRDRTN